MGHAHKCKCLTADTLSGDVGTVLYENCEISCIKFHCCFYAFRLKMRIVVLVAFF